MKFVTNMIWCIVALWVSTGLFDSLVDIWEAGGWWRIVIWLLLVLWTSLFVLLSGSILKERHKEVRK